MLYYWRMLKSLALLSCVFVSLLACSSSAAQDQYGVEESKPDIVTILTDDQAFSDLAKMPKTNRLLVDQGTLYRKAYVTLSVCCPSRATILTGQYPHNHGVKTNFNSSGAAATFRKNGADRNTIATRLNDAGYTTSHVGKYLNGYGATGEDPEYIPPGWDYWNTYSGAFHIDPKLNDNGTVNSYPKDVVLDQVAANKANHYIRNTSGPLYLRVGTHSPHAPYQYPKKYANLYSNATAPRYESFNERDVSDKPKWVREAKRYEASVHDQEYRDRLRSLKVVDDLVGTTVKALRESGKLSNTYIVFMSDNGWSYGQHGLRGKWTPYEEAARVPLVVRGPDVARGRINSDFVLNNDLAPTFAELANTRAPANVDGTSFVPLLDGRAPEGWRSRFLYESYHVGADPAPSPAPTYSGVRTLNYGYTEYATGERELYGFVRDPRQLDNLYPASDNLRRTLQGQLGALKSCAGDECRVAEGFTP